MPGPETAPRDDSSVDDFSSAEVGSGEAANFPQAAEGATVFSPQGREAVVASDTEERRRLMIARKVWVDTHMRSAMPGEAITLVDDAIDAKLADANTAAEADAQLGETLSADLQDDLAAVHTALREGSSVGEIVSEAVEKKDFQRLESVQHLGLLLQEEVRRKIKAGESITEAEARVALLGAEIKKYGVAQELLACDDHTLRSYDRDDAVLTQHAFEQARDDEHRTKSVRLFYGRVADRLRRAFERKDLPNNDNETAKKGEGSATIVEPTERDGGWRTTQARVAEAAAGQEPLKLERYQPVRVLEVPRDEPNRTGCENRPSELIKIARGDGYPPEGAMASFEHRDFFEQAEDKQRRGEIKRLIPERYFNDEKVKQSFLELQNRLSNKEPLDTIMRSVQGDRKRLVALKLLGIRLVQEHMPTDTRSWAEMYEESRIAFRYGEQLIQRAEIATLEARGRDIRPSQAQALYQRYVRYTQNIDISGDHRERLKDAVRDLVKKFPELTPKRLAAAQTEKVVVKKVEKSRVTGERVLPKRVVVYAESTSEDLQAREEELLAQLDRASRRANKYELEAYEIMEELREGADFNEITDEEYLRDQLVEYSLGDVTREKLRDKYVAILQNELGYGQSLKNTRLLDKLTSQWTERVYARVKVSGFSVKLVGRYLKNYVKQCISIIKDIEKDANRLSKQHKRLQASIVRASIPGILTYSLYSSVPVLAATRTAYERWRDVIAAREATIESLRGIAAQEADETRKAFYNQLADEYELLNVRDGQVLRKREKVDEAKILQERAGVAEILERKMRYSFEVEDNKGKIFDGVIEANKKQEARQRLVERGFTVRKLIEVKGNHDQAV